MENDIGHDFNGAVAAPEPWDGLLALARHPVITSSSSIRISSFLIAPSVASRPAPLLTAKE